MLAIISKLGRGILCAALCALAFESKAGAQTTFFASQTEFITRQSILYRFTATSPVSQFVLSAGFSGMTTVPHGVTVGNMNGGAKCGDILCFTGLNIYRLDGAFGPNPHLVQIGVTNTLSASPVFVGNRLFSSGGGFPTVGNWLPGVFITEVDPVTFTELWREPVGLFLTGSGGMFHVSGNTFRFVEHVNDGFWEYTLGSGNVSIYRGKTAIHDYSGLEQHDGRVYATFSQPQTIFGPRRFGFGTIDPNNGAYTELRVLDSYRDGITAVTVAVPLGFDGFLQPLGGADATGGSFSAPILSRNLGGVIPVRFTATCCGESLETGIHTLQLVRHTGPATSDPPINAVSADAATTGNQFRLTGGAWHFNLDTSSLTNGVWKLVATLSDGSQHTAWIELK